MVKYINWFFVCQFYKTSLPSIRNLNCSLSNIFAKILILGITGNLGNLLCPYNNEKDASSVQKVYY